MMQTLKSAVRTVGARPSVAVCRVLPWRPLLAAMRKLNGIQLTAPQLARITETVRSHPGCRLLVFGLGNDSAYWNAVNRGGHTVFLEDDADWLRTVLDRHPELTAFAVRYTTKRTECQALLDQPERLRLDLPEAVGEVRWDVILVDAPAGWHDNAPGRMQSIVAAARLAAPGGDVFVHDCHREVERVYCDRFLPAAGLLAEVNRLRHYRMPGQAAGLDTSAAHVPS
jgi:glucuronoxylan 4-O-methyltransferase